jgi:hypothetical protein
VRLWRQLLLALAPFAATAAVSIGGAESLLQRLACDIVSTYDSLNAALNGLPVTATSDSASISDYGESVETWLAAGNPGLVENGASRSKPRKNISTLRSLYIDAATVLCISQSGVQPTGIPVAAKGRRPAGIAVQGASAVGIGVRDGDVLTEVLGQPVRSAAQVIAVVIAARGANRPAIAGTLWRGTRSYSVVVEQPYTVPNCSAQQRDCWRARCNAEGHAPHGDSGAPRARSAEDRQKKTKRGSYGKGRFGHTHNWHDAAAGAKVKVDQPWSSGDNHSLWRELFSA